ncbi:MAG: hypothetical protein HYU51_09980 [Candidatus Rokubacteria bacterium]|nr:hypothetical protein [Candidatus Rokubacteria bacterium]
MLLAAVLPGPAHGHGACATTVVADVVAFDTPMMFNRLGAQNPNWITYALKRDVVALTGGAAGPGNAQMRKDKRIRPLVLRVNEGDCLKVNFTNWLAGAANPFVNADREPPMNLESPFLKIDDQVRGRYAGFHVRGLQLAGTIASDASNVGRNASSLVPSGGGATYTYFAPPGTRGAYLADSYGATFGGEATAGNTGQGMFAVVNVEPKGARWYRSQVTDEELRLATTGTTAAGQPILSYEARYPATNPDGSPSIWFAEGKANLPILNMRDGNAIVHSDINAIIAGPNPDGTFPASTYPLESAGKRNPAVPNRLEPFREFTTVFHDEPSVGQAFPGFYDANPVTRRLLHGVRDGFMINYGSGGIGSEIIANRLGVGPMWDCLSCAYEEFFLGSSEVGDPAMLVDIPANVGLEACDVAGANCLDVGPKATKALFPDDPSNVHHSYQNDRVVFRNLHAGKEHHIFHLHNHQWLFDANDDNSNYLDAQAIGPGSGYTYEINFGGSGNRNKTAGDAIFHCHFYPHFAQGMWELWRIHDVYETGTQLDVSGGGFHTVPFALFDGTPAVSSSVPGARMRALPDGEILAGTPIPALVPLPGKALPLMPGEVVVVQKNANPGVDEVPDDPVACAADPNGPTCGVQALPDSSQAHVVDRAQNPGYPFWIAGVDCGGDPVNCPLGVVGQRPPTPVLDMLSEGQAAGLRAGNGTLFGALNNLGGPADGGWDGGLPRHALDGFLAAGGRTPDVFHQEQTKLSFDKEIFKAKPVWFPEGGTDVEQAAMAFHAVRAYPSTAVRLDGTTTTADYITNGGPPQAGAPMSEPCIDDRGVTLFTGVTGQWFGSTPGSLVSLGTSPFSATAPRVYKGANIQIDAVFNKVGTHYPQQRIISLWEDALPFIDKQKPPEPFVIRNNTLDCTRYLHTNLVPKRFEVDDYQVTTPTDVIGQHIHLPKWDLPAADGSGNGWNYEDGTLSPGAVRERIHAINAFNPSGAGNPANSAGGGANEPLVALPHPFFGGGQGGEWVGARTTMQRWFFDPVLNVHHVDRGLGIIFTHDHFGPSTVQQIGLYATVLAEPAGSQWVHNETGVPMYTRADGGPTGWQAAILPGAGGQQFEAFREFWFQHSDFQSAYAAGVYIGAGPDGRPNAVLPDANSFRDAINPSVREFANPVFPDVIRHAADCKDGTPRPCPEAISADDPGFFVTNYRNEPVGWRVFDPNKIGPDGKPGTQADGQAGDLAFALQTRTDRKVPELNTRLGNTPYPPLTADIGPGDPFTPLMRSYAGDVIRIKSQAGGDEAEHNFALNAVKWLQGGSGHGRGPNTGWRNSQNRGISEQFTFAAPVIPFVGAAPAQQDYAYSHSTGGDGWWSGMWGILRTYNTNKQDLFKLPTTVLPTKIANAKEFNGVCPTAAPVRRYDVTAVLANTALGNALGVTIPANVTPTDNVGGPLDPAGGTLVYNPRPTPLAPPLGGVAKSGPLHDPTAILYVRTADLGPDGKLLPGKPVEPLVLRANAGECVEVTLKNGLPGDLNGNGFFDDNPDLAGFSQFIPVVPRDKNDPQGVTWFGSNLVRPSSVVGLHPQLVAYDVTRDDGMVVGKNPPGNEVVAPGQQKTSRWYVGDLTPVRAGGKEFNLVATPIEFGGSNLIPADILKQGEKGLLGAFSIGTAGGSIVETDTTWDHQQTDPNVTRQTRASATLAGGIRDFAVVFQDGLNLRYADGTAVENMGSGEEPPGSASKAINYGTEPMWFRFGLQPTAPFGNAGTPGSFGAVPNPEQAYSNALVDGDPATPVFTAAPGVPVRMHVLKPTGIAVDDFHARGSVFHLHGHVWQRAPYVCPGQDDGVSGLDGKCNATNFGDPGFEPGSRAIGVNPIGMYLGAQDSVLPGAHFDIVLPGAGNGPTGGAGGVGGVTGDYLFRDQASFGNTQGLWGIMRVE